MKLKPSRLSTFAAWSGIVAYCLAVILFAWNPNAIAQALAAIGIIAAFTHACLYYGLRSAATFLVICLVVTFGIENIGSTTGMPFGLYHFEIGGDLPHVGVIPIIVGPLWFGMGYFSWIVAGTLLTGAERRLNRTVDFVALPIVAAFVMTQWDLVMDPPESTISKAWIWTEGGADFGVPLSNYLGWLLTSWLFYQGFAAYLRHRPVGHSTPRRNGPALRFAAILFYASSGLTHVTPWLLGETGEVADGGGQTWLVGDLRETTVAVMMFTMLFTSGLAALNLLRREARADS